MLSPEETQVILQAAEKEGAEGLQQYQALLNRKDKNGDTPLHLALWLGQEQAAKALIAAKADIMAVGFNGKTPLHYAAENNLSSVLLLLLERGAVWDFEEEYNTDAYRLLSIYEVIKPCFARDNLLWLAKCIEGLFLEQNADPLLMNREALIKFINENFQKIEKLFFEHHTGALLAAQEILQVPSVAEVQDLLRPILLNHFEETYFATRKPEEFWAPFCGAMLLQKQDYQLLLQQDKKLSMEQALCKMTPLPSTVCLLTLEYADWCPSPQTAVSQLEQRLRGSMQQVLLPKPCDIGLKLFASQFALCCAHLDSVADKQLAVVQANGPLLPAFQMRVAAQATAEEEGQKPANGAAAPKPSSSNKGEQ